MAFHFIHQQGVPAVSQPVLGGGMYNFGYVHSSPHSVAGSGPVSGGGAFASSIKEISKALLQDRDVQKKVFNVGRALATEAGKEGIKRAAAKIGIPDRVIERTGEIIEREMGKSPSQPDPERSSAPAVEPKSAVSGSGLEDSVYCVKCKARRKPVKIKIVEYTTKKGMKGLRLSGKCPVCGKNVSKILSSKKTSKSNKPSSKPQKMKKASSKSDSPSSDSDNAVATENAIIAEELGMKIA